MDPRSLKVVALIEAAAKKRRMTTRQWILSKKLEPSAFYRWGEGTSISDRSLTDALLALRMTSEEFDDLLKHDRPDVNKPTEDSRGAAGKALKSPRSSQDGASRLSGSADDLVAVVMPMAAYREVDQILKRWGAKVFLGTPEA